MGQKPRQPLDAESARTVALRALGRRELSARELRSKLVSRGLDSDEAADLVHDLQTRDWQSDDRYAELLVRTRIGQCYGPLRIRSELTLRGVEEAIVQTCLSSADCDWDILAASALRRRFKNRPSGPAEARRRWTYLAGRGFEASQIRAAVEENPFDNPD